MKDFLKVTASFLVVIGILGSFIFGMSGWSGMTVLSIIWGIVGLIMCFGLKGRQ